MADESREGLVEAADDLRRQLGRLGLEDLLVVLGLEALGHLAREGQLVVGGGGGAEADGERRQPPARHLPHARHHHARVHAARQERAERDVALQPQPDRLADLVAQPLGQLGERRARPRRRRGRQRPVAAGAQRPGRQRRRVAGRQLGDAREGRARGRRVAVGEVVVQRLAVDLAPRPGVAEQRLDLGARTRSAAALPVVERLLAEPVAGEEQRRRGARPRSRRRTCRAAARRTARRPPPTPGGSPRCRCACGSARRGRTARRAAARKL